MSHAEPIAWLFEDTLPTEYPYDAMFAHSQVRGGVRMFPVFAPLPQEVSAAPAQEPVGEPLTLDQRYWLDRRGDIIAALEAEGLQIWSDKDRVWLHRLSASPLPQEPQEVKELTDAKIEVLAKESGFGFFGQWLLWQGSTRELLAFARAIERELRGAQEVKAGEWRTIESAPKDGTEILAWREDCGPFMAKWSCVNDLRTTSDKDRDELDEETLFSFDWFGGDSECTFRADGSEAPTHWMPLPADPSATLAASREGEQR